MYLSFQYSYLMLTVPFLLVWLLLFLYGKASRTEQLHISAIGAVLGPISELAYFRDYWMPQSTFPFFIGTFPFMIEDVLFGFAIGGIAAVVFEVLSRAHLVRLSRHSKYAISSWAVLLILYVAFKGGFLFGLNSIYASAMGFIIAGFAMVLARRDLLLDAVGSGFVVMGIMFVSYWVLFNAVSNSEQLLEQAWYLYDTPLGSRIAGVPLTEMVWGFTFGFLIGPLYEYMGNKKLVARR